ncbi:hypothetical protein ACO1O0_008471 [Amphichorda felina]
MATDSSHPKGILKKPSSAAPPSRRPDPKDVALQHAQILQQRKDLESQILDDLILLSEYPNLTTDASRPHPQDATDFKARPSDYDDLIEERNVNGLCGYTLCGRPRRQTGPGGEWKIAASGQIVRRRDVEKWCSQACARRALYVKVQLNETAAWERAGIPDIEIDLVDEDRSGETEDDRMARKLGELELDGKRQAARDTAALAMERGETSSLAQGPAVEVTLREKADVEPPEATSDEVFGDEDHLMVEGHKIKIGDNPNTAT